MKKKFMSVLLAVSLIASVLAGCGEKNDKGDKEIENVQEDDEDIPADTDIEWASAYEDYYTREDIIPERVKMTMTTDMEGVSMDIVVAVVGDSSYMRYALENATLDFYGTEDKIYAHTVMGGEESWIYASVTSEEEVNSIMSMTTDTIIVDAEDVVSCTYVEEVVEDGVIYDVLFLEVNEESETGDVYYYVNRETQKVDKFTMEQDGQVVECDVEEINSIELPNEAANATEGTMDDVAGALFAVMFFTMSVDPNAGNANITGEEVEVNVVSKYLTTYIVNGEENVEYYDFASFVCEYDVDGKNIKLYSYDSEGALSLAKEVYYSDRWDENKIIWYDDGNVSQVYEYEYEYDGDILLRENETHYDENGQITWKQIKKYEYNNQGNLIREVASTDDGDKIYSQITEHVYDEYQNLISVTGYDEMGNISGMSEEFEYNADGELIKCISYYNDRRICAVTTYEYYEIGELLKKTYCDYQHNTQEIDYVTENEYDLLGNVIKYVFYDSDGSIQTDLYEYDIFGNVIKGIYYSGEAVEAIAISEYDANGNLIRETSYDDLNNVVAQMELIYDVNGNVEEVSYIREGTIEGIKCTYDANGNRVQLVEYDSQGDMGKYEAEYMTIIAPNEKAAEVLLELTNELEISEIVNYVIR